MRSLLSIFKKQKNPETLLFIDLGTHSIKTSILKLPTELESTPQTLATSSHPIGRTMMRGHAIQDLDGVLDGIAHTIDQVIIGAGIQVKDTVMGLSAGSIRYTGLTIRIKRPNPSEVVTVKELDTIVHRIEEETIGQARSKNTSLTTEWEHLGVVITDYRIDGKIVTSPITLTGDTLECIVLHGFWLSETKKIVDIMGDQLGIDIMMVWETACAQSLRLRKEKDSFLLVDVGGRATEIVHVRDRRIVQNAVINIGSDDWTDALGKEMQIHYSQAEKIKHAYHDGVLDKDRTAETKEILDRALIEFVYVLAGVINTLVTKESAPSTIYFAGVGSCLDILKSKVIAFPWTTDGPFAQFPQVERMSEAYTNESLYYGYDLLS